MTDPTVLVTGANGFVGSSLIARAAGYRCIGLVRRAIGGSERAPGASGERRSVTAWSEEALYDVLDGVDAVVHSASVVHRPGAPDSEYVAFNVGGTRALLAACKRRGIQRLIHVSSIKVHGENPIGIIDEKTPTAPEGAYAQTKLEAERIVLEASAQGGPSATIFRLCPVYGVGDKGNVRTMIRAIARRRFAVPGDGSTRKSLVHVSTVSDAIVAALGARHDGIFVLADNETPTLRRLADAIARALGKSAPPRMPAAMMMGAAGVIQRVAQLVGRQTAISPQLIRKSLIDTVCTPALLEATFGIRCHRDLTRSIEEEVSWLRREERLG